MCTRMHVNKIFTANSISNSEMETNIQKRNGKINCGIFKERNDEINQLLKDRIHHPKICHFGIQIILSCRHLKRQLIHRAAPSALLSSAQTGKLKKELSWGVPSSLPQNFINQGKPSLITEEETGSGHHSQTSFVTNCHTSHQFL